MPDVYIISDEGDGRAMSIALGICSMLGLDQEESIFKLGEEEDSDNKDREPENEHVFNVTKATRSLVI